MNGSVYMKRLLLLRHAKSSWDQPDLPDFDRPLNKRGKRDAPLMASRLRERGEKPELILSSPAERAIKTARVVAEELGIMKKKVVANNEIYLASADELLIILRGLDESYNRVLLCGHNPGITNLCNFLADLKIDNIPTCGVVCLDMIIDSWSGLGQASGTLVYFDYPKKN
jgi:phosphohistidine phosphatase